MMLKSRFSGKATDGGTDGKHDASPVDPLDFITVSDKRGTDHSESRRSGHE